MARLQLASLSDIDPFFLTVQTIARKLEAKFGNNNVTVSRVHRNTRVYRILRLQEEFDNLRLLNVYQTTKDLVAKEVASLEREMTTIKRVPVGYQVGNTSVDMAYVFTLAVMPPEGDVPIGLVFVQWYSEAREQLAGTATNEDEEDEPEPEPELEFE